MWGAEMRATGAMGTMNRSVWSEGDVMGSSTVASAVLDRSIREAKALDADFSVNITFADSDDGSGTPFTLEINSDTTYEDIQQQLADNGIRDNVAGLVGNAIRSHVLSGGYGTTQALDIRIDL